MDFLRYVSSNLGIAEDELAGLLIRDALMSLSGLMIDPYSNKWAKFIGSALDSQMQNALANLATIFVTHYRNPRFQAALRTAEQYNDEDE